jgi:hypothetical protein
MDDVTRRDGRLRIAVLAAALVPRLVIGFLTFGSVDAIANFRNNLRIFHGFWAETPYFPFIELWLWISGNLAYFTDLPVIFPYKLLPIACDGLIALLLYDSAVDATSGLRRALLFAFAPVSIYITCIHAQWDSIWMYFLLLALVLLRIDKGSARLSAGAAFVLSVADKPIGLPLGLVLLPLRWKRLVAFAAGAAIMAAIYLAVLASVGWLMNIDNFMGIVDYVQRGVQLFGLPTHPINRLWSTVLTVAGFWLLMLRGRLRRDEVVLLYFCSILFLSGLGPQYLCWVVPFALFSGRIRFAAIYSLVAGIFLAFYYQLPAVNGFNAENLGAYGILKPLGFLSPPLPPVRLRFVEQFLGNYAIPLLGLSVVVLEVVRALKEKGRREEIPTPPAVRRYLLPAILLWTFIGAATIWSVAQPAIEDLRFVHRIEEKIAAYDVVRYRGPVPRDRGKIWVARSLVQPGVGNPWLNLGTIGISWVVIWCAVAVVSGRRRTA